MRQNKLHEDAAQKLLVRQLDNLLSEIREYDEKKSGIMAKYMRRKAKSPQGLFLVGKVGRGKTMLMDMFFDNLEIKGKKRVHFHEFMEKVHNDIHQFRKYDASDPVAQVAHEMSRGLTVLCFDEFEVSDVTDAMILAKLFGKMIEEGVVLLFTSNKLPEEHYKDGLQRQSYLEFCKKLGDAVDIFNLDSEQDYRQIQGDGEHENFFIGLSYKASSRMNERFKMLGGQALKKVKLQIKGREIELMASGKLAQVSFKELCGKPLGTSDYLKIAKEFDAVFLYDVPKMSAEMRNEARRFINLIDILYENETLLVMTAEAEPDELYVSGTGNAEFKRTASRLTEMRGWGL